MTPRRTRARTAPEEIPGLWEDYRSWLRSRGIRSPAIVVFGDYGRQRLGPDATLHVLLRRALVELPSAAITVLCSRPESIRRRYAHEPRIAACGLATPSAFLALLRCRILIVGGGEVNLPELVSRPLYAAAWSVAASPELAATAVQAAGGRVCFYAVAVKRLPSGIARRALSRLAHGVDVLSVRDRASLRLLKELPVERGIVRVVDPAAALEAAPSEMAEEALLYWLGGHSTRPLVLFSFAAPATGRKVRAIADCARRLVEEYGAQVLLLPADQDTADPAHDDLELARQVRAEAGLNRYLHVVEGTYHPSVVLAMLERANAALVERRSSMLLARAAQVPTWFVPSDPHVADEADSSGAPLTFVQPETFLAEPSGEWLRLLVHSSAT